jgi:hypothetical protein
LAYVVFAYSPHAPLTVFCVVSVHKGELLLMQGDEAEAEASFFKAIEITRRQVLGAAGDGEPVSPVVEAGWG